MRFLSRIPLILWIIAVCSVLIFFATAMLGIKVNITDSLPYGFYIKTDKQIYEAGDIVDFVVPNNEVTRAQFRQLGTLEDPPHNYLKIVYGVAGDEVVTGDAVLVGDYALLMMEGQPTLLIGGIIPDDFIFAATPHKYSFDSRYYGLIDTKTITGVYKPLLIFGG